MITSDEQANVLVVRRVLPASRERVFAAWLDPVSLAQWMRAGLFSSVEAETDPRVGGAFRIVMQGRPGGDHEHRGEYLVIDPPSRLSFTWESASTDHRPTVVDIELLERGTRTELVLTHRQLPATRVEQHRQGWTAILAALDATLAAG